MIPPQTHFELERVRSNPAPQPIHQEPQVAIESYGEIPIGVNIVAWIQEQDGIDCAAISKISADVEHQAPHKTKYANDGAYDPEWENAPVVFETYNDGEKDLLCANVHWHIRIGEGEDAKTIVVQQKLFTTEEISKAEAPGRRAAENTQAKTRALTGIDAATYAMKQGLYGLSSLAHTETSAANRADMVRKTSQARCFQIKPRELTKEGLSEHSIKLLDERQKKISVIKRTNQAFYQQIDRGEHPVPGSRVKETEERPAHTLTRFERNQLLGRYSLIQHSESPVVSDQDVRPEETSLTVIEEDLQSPLDIIRSSEEPAQELANYDFPPDVLLSSARQLQHRMDDILGKFDSVSEQLAGHSYYTACKEHAALAERLQNIRTPEEVRDNISRNAADFLEARARGPSPEVAHLIEQMEVIEEQILQLEVGQDDDGEFDNNALQELTAQKASVQDMIKQSLESDKKSFTALLTDESIAIMLYDSGDLQSDIAAGNAAITALQPAEGDAPPIIQAKMQQIDFYQKRNALYQRELAYRQQYRAEHGTDYKPGIGRFEGQINDIRARQRQLASQLEGEAGEQGYKASKQLQRSVRKALKESRQTEEALALILEDLLRQLRSASKKDSKKLKREVQSVEAKLTEYRKKIEGTDDQSLRAVTPFLEESEEILIPHNHDDEDYETV